MCHSTLQETHFRTRLAVKAIYWGLALKDRSQEKGTAHTTIHSGQARTKCLDRSPAWDKVLRPSSLPQVVTAQRLLSVHSYRQTAQLKEDLRVPNPRTCPAAGPDTRLASCQMRLHNTAQPGSLEHRKALLTGACLPHFSPAAGSARWICCLEEHPGFLTMSTPLPHPCFWYQLQEVPTMALKPVAAQMRPCGRDLGRYSCPGF